ncbi:MAG: DUF2059 domain-containing protein [Rhodanobacter sp.]
MRLVSFGLLAGFLVCGATNAATPAATTAAASSQPASRASINELLQVTQSHKLIDSMTARMDGMLRQSIARATAGKPIDAGEQKIIDAQVDKMETLMQQEVSWDSLQPMYVDIYSKTFTQQDINGMLAFYRSPAGQAMIAKMPALMAQLMQSVQSRMAALMPKIQQISDETTKQLAAYRASKHDASAPAAKSN